MLSQCDADLSGSRVITRLTAHGSGNWDLLVPGSVPVANVRQEGGRRGKRGRQRHALGNVEETDMGLGLCLGQFNVYQEPIIACLAPASLLLPPSLPPLRTCCN